ncbi:MAG: hypothetical protein JWL81_1326, partial [Verrucomicrobiales bacterium]|nr:hypothetical protein [Verrucomicrobiales bacterium]
LSGGGYQDPGLWISLDISGRNFSAKFDSRSPYDSPFLVASVAVAGKDAEKINEAHYKRSGGRGYTSRGSKLSLVSTFVPEHLPSDWRGYMGLDSLALGLEEWDRLGAGVRAALRQWVIMGGMLDFYQNGGALEPVLRELKIGAEQRGGRVLGLGWVRVFPWDGKPLEGRDEELERFSPRQVGVMETLTPVEPNAEREVRMGEKNALAAPARRHAMAAEDFRSVGVKGGRSVLPDAMGERSFAAWQVGVILVLFGILVGPVNLFYFAGAGRRHRLFFTTPVIALGASVVLVAVILWQDGTGGTGRRAALIEIRPDENNAYLKQYQISRTGVLFSNTFSLEDPAMVTPLVLDESRWTRLKPPNSGQSENQQYSVVDGRACAGDWFQSRSEQGQRIESIRPGRGRLELKSGTGNPVIVSSYPAVLEAMYYQDTAGAWWMSNAPLATGGSVQLQPMSGTPDEARNWLEDNLELFPVGDRVTLASEDHRGKFYAVSREPGAGFVPTLPSLRWESDFAMIHGRLAEVP